ncbi:uncharacterized protein LOC120008864 [Tripterygium wilfordii]|uniref:uncharacterized protein LOC120008864 n=1 Tax=Tripterygium wilfordii TaxID=458696 RepID=UPI0018F8550D|nr:uncharacterized protein LOC120008864 [Tripterygium wilfordii]XP_038715154.1 uncharacterized protein LOC120008864 [Tripterygium wilfordii]XP_038715155.1 uncharacterized protein LOC120008864 [Tripterygium wilfordii]
MGNTRSYSKPSMSDAKERSYSKPSKFDAKESNKPSKQQEQQVISTKDLILQKAKPFSDDYPTYDDPIVWGVLTAITKHSIYGRRYQGCQGHCIDLKMTEHCIGLVLKEMSYQIPNEAVNNGYGIYITRVDSEAAKHLGTYYPAVFLWDISAFDTYVNWKKLTKGEAVNIFHGDIISLFAAPDDVNAVGYVYQMAYRFSPWQEVRVAASHDKFEALHKEFAEMKLLCVKERVELKADIMAELRTEVLHKEFAEMKKLLCVKERVELKADIMAELGTELKSELRTELQAELLTELRAELKSELRAKLKTELMVPGFK